MIFLVLIILVLIYLAGVSEAAMDKIQFHFHESIFSNDKFKKSFWNPDFSWTNKYKNGNILEGPKFWLSTTLLVFTTDGWHLFKFFRNLFFFSALAIAFFSKLDFTWTIIITIVSRTVYGIAFNQFYNKYFKHER